MALNSDFKVKDSLYVGSSACFVTQTDSPVILSAGSSLFDIFLQEGEVSASCALTSGLGVDSFTFDGTADASVAVDGSVIDGIAEGTGQGQIAVTNLDNTTTQVNVHDMGVGDSPVFGNLTVTGLSATAANSGILSAGRDLNEIFVTSAQAGSVCSVTAGNGTVTIGGSSANPTVRVADTCVTAISGAYCDSCSSTQGNIGFTRLNGGTDSLDIGLCAGDSPTFAGLNSTSGLSATGNITVGGTVDGVDIAARDAVLTSTTTTATNACTIAGNALPKAGGAMSGAITTTSTFDGRDVACDGVTTDTLQSLSAANVTNVTASATQGRLVETSADGTTDNVDLTDLGIGSTPTFTGLCLGAGAGTDDTVLILNSSGEVKTDEIDNRVWGSTLVDGSGTANFIPLWSDGNTIGDSTLSVHDGAVTSSNAISAVGGFSGDGSGLTGVTATACFPGICCGSIVAADKFFINDGANKHICYGDLINDIAGGEGISVTGTDSLCVAGISNVADNNVPRWTGSAFGDSMLSQNGGATTLTVAGSAVIQGDLTVEGDFTCLETLIETTSAVCITNAGTGPALYAEQTGSNQPIARFVDTEGGNITFADGGKVGIGTEAPSQKLTISGGLSANGIATIDGLATLGGGITATLGAGTSNTVVVSNGGSLVTDGIDSKVWACKVVDYGSSTGNKLARFCGNTGTLGDSSITDNGTLITLDADVTVGNGDSIKLPATGGSRYAEEQTFTATVGTTETGVPTFAKSGLKQVKYLVSLTKGVNVTAFEVNAVYNGTAPCGTTYGVVDAQAASQLADVKITSAGTTIDLDITAAAASTTAVIHGVAVY